jgi:YD repeat-containing protein
VLARTSSAVFDDLDRPEQVIGALGQTSTFTYDVVGNRITATDALNQFNLWVSMTDCDLWVSMTDFMTICGCP